VVVLEHVIRIVETKKGMTDALGVDRDYGEDEKGGDYDGAGIRGFLFFSALGHFAQFKGSRFEVRMKRLEVMVLVFHS
jgi:hypothetical protein